MSSLRLLGEQPVPLLNLPTCVLLKIADFVDLWDFARLDAALRKRSEWLLVLPYVKFDLLHKYLPDDVVLSWCYKREIKIKSLEISSYFNYFSGKFHEWYLEFMQYLTSGGNNSIVELVFSNQTPELYPDFVARLCESHLTLPSLKRLTIGSCTKLTGTGFIIVNEVIELILRCPQLVELKFISSADDEFLYLSLIHISEPTRPY